MLSSYQIEVKFFFETIKNILFLNSSLEKISSFYSDLLDNSIGKLNICFCLPLVFVSTWIAKSPYKIVTISSFSFVLYLFREKHSKEGRLNP
jgi:hypothetical protein